MGQTLAEVLREHALHASMNICTGCRWRATPNAGSLADQHADHLADVATAWQATEHADLLAVIQEHIPRDRRDDDGAPVATHCTCGGWEGDYFADGEAGPFDEHLAAMVGAWLGTDAGQKAAEAARNGPRSDSQSTDVNLDDGNDERRRAGQIECRHVWFDSEAEGGAELCVRCNSEREGDK